jgi:hypothetical protein
VTAQVELVAVEAASSASSWSARTRSGGGERRRIEAEETGGVPKRRPPPAANGFLRTSAPLLCEKSRRQGIAAVEIRISHHFAAVCPDIERFAAEEFITLAMVNGRQRIVVRAAIASCSAPARWRLPARAP